MLDEPEQEWEYPEPLRQKNCPEHKLQKKKNEVMNI